VITLLSARADDEEQPFNFAEDIAIAPNGKIYFTDGTTLVPEKARNGHVNLV